jgi:Zn-dependent protease with chaperone function
MKACPDCGAQIMVDAGFTAWCDECGWNLLASGAAKTPTRRERRRSERAGRHEDAILARAMRERGQRVRHDFGSLIAVGLAVVVHLITLTVAGFGVWLCWEGRRAPLLAVPALVCFVMAYALRPRLGRLPRHHVLTRERYPLLFGLLDSISDITGAPTFDCAVLERHPSAATGRIGLRRRRVVFIGASLWSVLEWDERIAVLAHEAGHNVSNDSRRGYLLGTSLKALEVWITTLTPRSRLHNFPQLLFRTLVRAPLRWVAGRMYLAQMRLSTGVSRMAEYRADEISASSAGTEASVRALDKLLITSDFVKNLRQTILWRPDVSLWVKQKEFFDTYPHRQRARLRRIDQLSAASVYSTHPTISRRIAYLAADPVTGSALPFSAEHLSQIDAELEPQLRLMAETMRRGVYSRLTPAQLETLG